MLSTSDFFGEISSLSSEDAELALKLTIFSPAELKVAVVDRSQLGLLEPEWSSSGVYVLLERPDRDGCWEGYVGKSAAAGGVKGRLGGHLCKKADWYKAVAVCPEGKDWDEAEVAWLEARLYQLLSSSSNVTLSNSQEPGDGRLSDVRQMRINKVTQAIGSVLALVGHPISSSPSDHEQPEAGEDASAEVVHDREYWETIFSTPEIMAQVDDLLSMIQEADPSASLNYQKTHIGLMRGSRRSLDVMFGPKKGRLGLSLRLRQTEEYNSLLDGVDLQHKYDSLYGYQINELPPEISDRTRSVLTCLFRDGYELYKVLGGRWPSPVGNSITLAGEVIANSKPGGELPLPAIDGELL